MGLVLAILAVVVAVAVLALLAGAVTLAMLARGARAECRFLVDDIDAGRLTTYLAGDGQIIVRVSETTSVAPQVVRTTLQRRPYLSALPFFVGPVDTTPDGAPHATRRISSPLVAIGEYVATTTADRIVMVGTGTSIPLIVRDFAEDFTIADEGGRTSVTWTIALRLNLIGWLPLSWLGVFARPLLRLALRKIVDAAAVSRLPGR